jgi:two-component system C4-dicarboxylate transport sensor histidine kinase DctB
MARVPWRLVALSDASGVLRNARNTGLAAGFAVALAGLLALLFMQRHRSARQRLAATEALQRVHSEHNAQLRETNEQLRREVAEREHAEAVLREAQDGLVQAAKLALLGQMSAGVTHEINQPLTALRALADNARQLVELGRLEEVKQNLRSISELTQRMGRLTAQLKGFARKAPASRQSVPVRRAIGNALLLLDSRVRAERAQVNVDGDEQLCAACDSTRLEQVLVNLVANALDAMAGTDGPRRVSLRCWLDEAASRVRVRVCDTGSGIPDHAMSRLFEPFFTTKKPGEGLGLGLMISSQIVREWGGSLAGANLATGACFEFDLPLAREPAHA